MKKKKTNLTPEFWRQHEENMRFLQERIKIVDQKITAKRAAEGGAESQA